MGDEGILLARCVQHPIVMDTIRRYLTPVDWLYARLVFHALLVRHNGTPLPSSIANTPSAAQYALRCMVAANDWPAKLLTTLAHATRDAADAFVWGGSREAWRAMSGYDARGVDGDTGNGNIDDVLFIFSCDGRSLGTATPLTLFDGTESFWSVSQTGMAHFATEFDAGLGRKTGNNDYLVTLDLVCKTTDSAIPARRVVVGLVHFTTREACIAYVRGVPMDATRFLLSMRHDRPSIMVGGDKVVHLLQQRVAVMDERAAIQHYGVTRFNDYAHKLYDHCALHVPRIFACMFECMRRMRLDGFDVFKRSCPFDDVAKAWPGVLARPPLGDPVPSHYLYYDDIKSLMGSHVAEHCRQHCGYQQLSCSLCAEFLNEAYARYTHDQHARYARVWLRLRRSVRDAFFYKEDDDPLAGNGVLRMRHVGFLDRARYGFGYNTDGVYLLAKNGERAWDADSMPSSSSWSSSSSDDSHEPDTKRARVALK